jgi:hypothetical protein
MVAMVLALLAVTGCATHQLDWNTRIGTYTYDQAILDMGPPAKEARLKDGTVVAEWMTQRGHTYTYYTPPYYYPYYRGRYYGPVYGTPSGVTYPDVFIQLTFDPQGKLTAWKKVAL